MIMNKNFMELIKEIANRYSVKLERVEDEEKAGIFIETEGKNINVEELDEKEVFDNIFKVTTILEYKALNVEVEKSFANKELNIVKNIQGYSIEYNINKERVA